jgi:hypothetical protein
METMVQERRCKTPGTFWPLENYILNGGFSQLVLKASEPSIFAMDGTCKTCLH